MLRLGREAQCSLLSLSAVAIFAGRPCLWRPAEGDVFLQKEGFLAVSVLCKKLHRKALRVIK